MKINLDFIKKIFNGAIVLKNKEDKIKLSKYTEYIPMYDIYTENIYPINNLKLHYRLKNCHYRFVTSEVKQWIENKMNKTKNNIILKKHKLNLNIISNYDLPILEKTSYETLYKYSPDLGLSISICKRNSFHPYSRHLKPYYSRDEIIKLGMNNNLIDKLTSESLVDKELHYKICKIVSKNDISFNQILMNIKHIVDNNCINWVNFYSLIGSYIFNQALRNNEMISKYMIDGINKLNNCISTTPSFDTDYYFYRFLENDNFLKKLTPGDVFIDKGFLSTTRDPFYSPGIDGEFGLILLKINIPKNKKGVGLFVENFSMFPQEEEFLLATGSKLKLISKNENFKYYHVNKDFEKKIKKKYEFTFIGNEKSTKLNVFEDRKIPEINIKKLNLLGGDRLSLFKLFADLCDKLGQFKYNNIIFISQFFDSESSYSDFYYNSTNNGFVIYYYDNGYPILSLEFGKEYVVNFTRTYNLYNKNQKFIEIDKFTDIITYFGRIFKYKKIRIFYPKFNFTKFEKNYTKEDDKILLNTYMYDKAIYEYIKYGKKYYDNKLLKYTFGYYNLNNFKKDSIPKLIISKLPKELKESKNLGELYIKTVENHYYFYPKLIEYIENYYYIFDNCFVELDTISYLKSIGDKTFDIPTIKHVTNIDKGDRFKLIYENNIRRK
jgi:hypothetical protein